MCCVAVACSPVWKTWLYSGRTNTLYFHLSFSGANHQLRVNVTSSLVKLITVQHRQVFSETHAGCLFSPVPQTIRPSGREEFNLSNLLICESWMFQASKIYYFTAWAHSECDNNMSVGECVCSSSHSRGFWTVWPLTESRDYTDFIAVIKLMLT